MRKKIGFQIVVAMTSVLALSACTKKSTTASSLDSGVNAGLNGEQVAGSAIPVCFLRMIRQIYPPKRKTLC
jgi:hypothetical protein